MNCGSNEEEEFSPGTERRLGLHKVACIWEDIGDCIYGHISVEGPSSTAVVLEEHVEAALVLAVVFLMLCVNLL